MNEYIGKMKLSEVLVKRFVRSLISTAIATGIAILQEDPRYAVLIPILQTVGKYLREKYGWSWIPV